MARLERHNRLLLLALVGILTVGALAAFLPQRRDEPVVRAEKFELVDDRGRVRAELRMQEDGGTGLFLLDETGQVRLSVSHDQEQTALFIRDAAGDARVGAAQFAHGGGGFALHGEGLKGAAVLYLKENGSLRFFDRDGTVTFQFPPTAD